MKTTRTSRASRLLSIVLVIGGLAVGPAPAPITEPSRCIVDMNVKLLCVVDR